MLEELDGRVVLAELGKWNRLDSLLSREGFDESGMIVILCTVAKHEVCGEYRWQSMVCEKWGWMNNHKSLHTTEPHVPVLHSVRAASVTVAWSFVVIHYAWP